MRKRLPGNVQTSVHRSLEARDLPTNSVDPRVTQNYSWLPMAFLTNLQPTLMPLSSSNRNANQPAGALILALLLWLAPMPIGHCHGDCASRWSASQMAAHLQLYHGGTDISDDFRSGWHWHWMLRANGPLGLDVTPVMATTTASLDCHTDAVPWIGVIPSLNSGAWNAAKTLPVVCGHRGLSYQTIALIHQRQSLPELLGISRC